MRLKMYVKYGKAIPTTRYDAVGDHFVGLKGASFGANISGVDDTNFPDGDPRAVLVLLVGLELAYNFIVGYFFFVVYGDISVTYGVEDVGAFNILC